LHFFKVALQNDREEAEMIKDELIRKAEEHESNSEWKMALDIYEELLKQFPEEILFIEKTAWCASRLSKYDLAIKHFILLTEKESQIAKWFYYVGYQYYMQKDWESANKWFEKALFLYPEYLVVKYRYAYSLRQMCASMMVLKKDEYWKALKLLTECDSIWDKYSPEQKKQNEDTYAAICFQHAKLLIDRNHIEEAIEYLEKALSIKPEEVEYQYQLSKSYLSIGKIEKAKEILPSNSPKYYVKELEIDILIAEKKQMDAIEKYNTLLKYRKKDYLYRELGMQYYEIDNLKDAISCILQAEKMNSQNHLTQYAKAKILFKAGFLLEAKNTAECAASLKSTKFSSIFTEAIELSETIQQLIKDKSYSSDNEETLQEFLHKSVTTQPNVRLEGNVSNYNSSRGFGFIECNNRRYFFHISNVPSHLQNKIVEGIMLSFLPTETKKGLSATSLSIVK